MPLTHLAIGQWPHSVSQHVGLSLGLIITWKLVFPKGSDLREIQRPISDVTNHNFWHIVLGTHTDHLWASVGGKYTRCEHQKSEIIGAITKLVFHWMDWTPASGCHLMPDHKLETLYGISCWETSYLCMVFLVEKPLTSKTYHTC